MNSTTKLIRAARHLDIQQREALATLAEGHKPSFRRPQRTPCSDVLARLPKGTIARLVTGIDRTKSVREIFGGTNRTKYFYANWVFDAASRHSDTEKMIYYLPPNGRMTPKERHDYVASFGMQEDFVLQYRDNELNPAFADDYPNNAQLWRTGGGFGCAAWGRDGSERCLVVFDDSFAWYDGWWSGCCK